MDLLKPNGPIEYCAQTIDGSLLHWCELPCASDTSEPPLLLLHGLHDSHLTWRHIAGALANGRRVLMPDLFGCGLSDRPDASYALSWHAQMIAKWLHAIGVHEVDVVGHSFGGGVGQMLLLEGSLRVRRLALLAPGGLGRDVGVWLRLATVPWVERYGQPFMRHGTKLALRLTHHSLSPADAELMCSMNAREGSARAFARTVRDVIDWRGQRQDFLRRAHEIAAFPITIVCWGDCDGVIPMTHGIAFAKAVEGVSFHRVEGAGHWLHHEKAEAVTALLREFFGDTEQRPMRLRPKDPTLWVRTVQGVRAVLGTLRTDPLQRRIPARG